MPSENIATSPNTSAAMISHSFQPVSQNLGNMATGVFQQGLADFPQYQGPLDANSNRTFLLQGNPTSYIDNPSPSSLEFYNSELVIIEQPSSSIRFRYQSEKGSHGGLTGANNSRKKKTFPTVKLENFVNYPGRQVFIRASLYTNEKKPRKHVHTFEGRDCKDGVCKVPLSDDFTASFQNLRVTFNCKKNVADTIFQRKVQQYKRESGNCSSIPKSVENELFAEAKEESQSFNLSSVIICFQAFYDGSSSDTEVPICLPVFSSPIVDQKSLDMGDLKIVRMDRYSGSCIGGDEVFLLCDKVNKKTIKVRFFEENNKWEDFGTFNEVDVHHQVAIVFKTPAYYRLDIETPVKVFLQLFRSNDGQCSEPVDFTYIPAENIDEQEINRKRKKLNPYQEFNTYQSSPPAVFRSSSEYSPYTTHLQQLPNDGNGTTDSSLSGGHTSDSSDCNYLTTTSSAENASSSDVLDFDVSMDLINNMENLFDFDAFSEHMESLEKAGLNETSQNPMLSSANINLPSNMEIMNQSADGTFVTDSMIDASKIHEQMYIAPCSATLLSAKSLTKSKSQHDEKKLDHRKSLIKLKTEEEDSEVRGEMYEDTLPEQFGNLSISKSFKKSKWQPAVNTLAHRTSLTKLKTEELCAREKKISHSEIDFKKITDLVVKRGFTELLQNMRNFVLVKNEDGDNLLHLAVVHQQRNDVLRLLLQNIAGLPHSPVNELNKLKQTALHLATLTNNREAVKLLVQHGGEPNILDREGNTAIHLAVKYNHIGCLDELCNLLNYSSLNRHNFPLLNIKNYSGLTPLHLAVIQKSKDCLEILCQIGADVNIRDGMGGRVALHLAVEHCPELVPVLTRQPSIEVDVQDYAGYTSLHLACSNKQFNSAYELMLAEANPLIEKFDDCDNGITPFDLANGDSSLIAILSGEPINETAIQERAEEGATASPILVARASENMMYPLECSRKFIENTDKQLCDKVDSGFISGNISLLDDATMSRVCDLLDPPSEDYKKLALYVGGDENIVECVPDLVQSPTKAIIENFLKNGRDLPELIGALELADLHEAHKIMENYYKIQSSSK